MAENHESNSNKGPKILNPYNHIHIPHINIPIWDFELENRMNQKCSGSKTFLISTVGCLYLHFNP